MEALTRLAVAARSGDPEALAALVDAGYDHVWRLCAHLVDGRSADDLAQEAFARAIRSLPSFRADASARSWLLAIARNTCMDELRTRTRRRRAEDLTPVAPIEPSYSGTGEETVVEDLLARLEPDRRLAFVLTQILGLSYQQAAHVCDCPTGTIRSRVARARADLITQLDEQPTAHRHRPNQGPATPHSA